MTFRDIKAGDPIYVYDRSTISLTTEIVEGVTPPHLDQTNPSLGMVVDVTFNGTPHRFKESQDVGMSSPYVYATDQMLILREVEAKKMSNESQIARVDQLKAELPKLDAIIDQLSPERKQKKDQEARMAKMEKSIGDLTSMLAQFMNSSNNNKQNGSK